jgi:hypothetical protein
MRNQRRKLFFELMRGFRLFLDKAPPEVAAKSYLYLHTSYPEKAGWDIPDGIMQNNLGGKVLSTYICKNCKSFSIQMFRDALTWCPHCSNLSCICPTVGMGVTTEQLVQIYNTFDIYAQYAICEGFGMPQVEAAACGVPVVATDYSAMSDVIRYTKGYGVRVKNFFREIETNAERAYPDNEELSKILLEFFTMAPEDRMAKSFDARKGAVERYNWDGAAAQWEKYIDEYSPVNEQGLWDSAPSLSSVPPEIPAGLDNNQAFARWIFEGVLREPERLHSEEGVRLVRDLNFGAHMGQGVLEATDKQQVFDRYKQRAMHKNQVEQARVGIFPLVDAPYVTEAHNRKKSDD